MLKINFNAPDHQEERLRAVQLATGFTISELMRRMLDHFLQEEAVNELAPLISGQIRFGGR